MGEEIFVGTSRTVPRTLHRIGATLVEHLHDQMTMQAHGWMTVNHVSCLCGFRCNCHFNLRLVHGHFPSDLGVRVVRQNMNMTASAKSVVQLTCTQTVRY